jgi:photosystem II stability/assembly factor-like uncharacterized protein
MRSRTLIRTCTLIIEVASLLTVMNCSSRLPEESPPDYLQEQIQRSNPSDPLKVFPSNGPYGGNSSVLATAGNTIVLATEKGQIYRSKADKIEWILSRIDSKVNRVYSIVPMGNRIFAATNGGILQSVDDGLTWQELTKKVVEQELYVFEDSLLATTTSEIVRFDLKTNEVSRVNIPKSETRSESYDFVWALAAANNQVLVASRDHLFRGSDLVTWSRVDDGLEFPNLSTGKSTDGETALTQLEVNADNIFALVKSRRGFESTSKVFVSQDLGTHWEQIPTPNGVYDTKLFSTPDAIFLKDPGGLFQLSNNTWVDLGLPFSTSKIESVTATDGQTIVATEDGVYSSKDRGPWQVANNGLVSWRSSGSLLVTSNYFFAVADGKLFRSNDEGKSWINVKLKTPPPSIIENPESFAVRIIALAGETIFAYTEKGLFSGKTSDSYLSPLSVTLDNNPGEELSAKFLSSLADNELFLGVTLTGRSKLNSVTITDDGSEIIDGFVSSSDLVLQSNNLGKTWERTKGLPDTATFGPVVDAQEDSRLKAVRGRLYLTVVTSGYQRVFRFNRGQNRWEEISNGIKQDFITTFGASDQVLYAAASRRVQESTQVLPRLFKLENPERGTEWTAINASNLTGRIDALWSDRSHPEVVVAGSTEGLFWSDDGGASFQQVNVSKEQIPFREVSAISELNGQLFINTDSGVFYLYDQIPRGKWYEQWRVLLADHKWAVVSVVALVLLLVVLSTRLISLLLQLDLWGLNQIAPAFYLLKFGRWKLYRGYRANLLAASDIKESVEHYVDLPYEADVNVDSMKSSASSDDPLKLADLFTRLTISQRVAVIADGGCGKSTLCAFLAHYCLSKGDLFGKHLEPVIVDGLSYAGDILTTITDSLNHNRAYVNKAIASSQLAAGNLLIILDGFTEIRETYLAKASSEDLPGFIKQHPDTPFILTSRSELPPSVKNALGEPITIRLGTIEDEEGFLSQYLKRGSQEVQALMNAINIKFKNLPRIPLLLKLVATIYDKKGQVPKDTAALFEEYVQHLLRPAATGIDEPNGLNFALRHLVRETYLKNGGDRGLTIDRGVELLEQIKERLASYDLTIAPIRLLQILTRAGLYKAVGQNLKFFHDSFESYFGAQVLEIDFRAKQYELIKQSSVNPRLLETWQFLNDIIPNEAEKQFLQKLKKEAEQGLETEAAS